MELWLVLFIVSFLILLLGGVYKKMEELALTEPLIAMLLGVLLGPDVLGVVETEDSQTLTILEKTCEFTIAMALMATALRLPYKFLKHNVRTQSILIFFGMVLMFCFSSGIIYLLFPDFTLAECLLIGAIITPTDPVVSSTIVSGDKAIKFLPERIRHSISFESGINDGLAFPLVIFSTFLITNLDFPLNKFLIQTILYETLLCAALAFLTGYISGKFMHIAHKMGIMTPKGILPFSLGLAFLLLSGFNLLGMNGILAVFLGGLAFAKAISGNEDIEEERIQETMERITLIPVFFIFGLVIPWKEWLELGWTGAAFILMILLFRRIPALIILKPFLPQFKGKLADVFMIGWFGPIGVAALYYAIKSEEKLHLEEAWIIPGLIVFASTLIHGITSLPFGKLYHNKWRKN